MNVTLSRLIEALQSLEEKHGGDLRVAVPDGCGVAYVTTLVIGDTDNGTPSIVVLGSREAVLALTSRRLHLSASGASEVLPS